MANYHYDGKCNITEFSMWLSGWTFKQYELKELPEGYVDDDDFGARVHKYDWFELLEKFPFWIALLVLAALGSLIGIVWLFCRVKGGRNKHPVCRCFVIALLLLLLVPSIIGLYMSARANHLLRKKNYEQRKLRELRGKLPETDDRAFRSTAEFENDTLENDYEKRLHELRTDLNHLIASEFNEFQRTMVTSDRTKLKQLKYLFMNKIFYKNSLALLRETAYELAILGMEIDDLLRALTRDGFNLLPSNGTSHSNNDGNLQPPRRLNVWHFNTLYFHYVYLDECLKYLMEAYTNITKIQGAIARTQPNPIEIENIQAAAPNLSQQLKKYRKDWEMGEKREISKVILYLALAMIFVVAGLLYLLFMTLGFSIFHLHAEANCLIKCFIFFSIFTIGMLAFLTVIHFLLTMVLHKGICHEKYENYYFSAQAKSRSIAPIECASYKYDNEGDFPIVEIRKALLTNLNNKIPQETITQLDFVDEDPNITASMSEHEKWYEAHMQPLLRTDDLALYVAYAKQQQQQEKNKPKAQLFLCKYNTIEKMVKKELYAKEFVPNATLLYQTETKITERIRADEHKSFAGFLKNALNELYVYDKFYALTRRNFLDALDGKMDVKLRKFSSEVLAKSRLCEMDSEQKIRGKRSTASNKYTKCGCKEDWLMIYAIGGALMIASLFLIIILMMCLYKLNKRGPANVGLHSSKSGVAGGSSAEASHTAQTATAAGSTHAGASSAGAACNETEQDKECVLNIKGDITTRPAIDCCSPSTVHASPLINTVNFIPPLLNAFGYQQNPQQMAPPCCCPPTQQPTCACHNQNDGVILPLRSRSRTQMGCAGTSAEAQLVGGGTTRDKTVTVMVFQGPKDRQPLVTYPPPKKL